MSPFVVFGMAAVGTFVLRTFMVLGDGRLASISWLQDRIPFVSPAVLAAIVTSAVFLSNGESVAPDPAVIAALAVGCYAARRTGNPVGALAAGLPVYWIAALAGLT